MMDLKGKSKNFSAHLRMRNLFWKVRRSPKPSVCLKKRKLSPQIKRRAKSKMEILWRERFGQTRYRIIGLIGKGGMGEVYKAEDLKLNQTVALKFLPENLEKNEAALNRFIGEVRTARQVSHPNVCRVFDIGDINGKHFLSMEYVDGDDLSSLLRRIGRLPSDKAVEISRQICLGLHAIHDAGILHRDLKPANIIIDSKGKARITDFGIAGLEADISKEEIRVGTPAYMSPEQITGKKLQRGAIFIRSDFCSMKSSPENRFFKPIRSMN